MLPIDAPLANENYLLPYVFVGDNAFALGTHIMKPYFGVFEKGNKSVYTTIGCQKYFG